MPGDKRRKRRMDELRKDMIKHEGILEQRLEADDIPEAKRLRGSIIERKAAIFCVGGSCITYSSACEPPP